MNEYARQCRCPSKPNESNHATMTFEPSAEQTAEEPGTIAPIIQASWGGSSRQTEETQSFVDALSLH
jgi:hypothetical protein